MKALRAAALCALAFAAYANSLHGGFAFDSRQLVLQDPRVHAATAENVDLILHHSYWWPYGESGLYRPLTTLSYLFNYAVVGAADRPTSYHALNVILHAANVLLFWLLVLRTTRNGDASFAAAAIWAVLPLSTEAVTNIVGRADLLAAFGILGALLLYARARDARGISRSAALVGVAAASAVAVFSKESGVAVGALIAVYEIAWWRRDSAGTVGAGLVASGLPLIAMWSVRSSVIGAAPAAEFTFADNPILAAGFWVGRLTALKVAGLYLWRLAWPATLSADASYAQIPLARGSVHDWLGWLTVAAVVAALVLRARRDSAAAFFGAFAAVAFAPAANLLFATGTIYGERLMYLPSAGLVAVAALALFAKTARTRTRGVAAAVTTAIVLAGALRTWARNPDWTSDVTLWRATVAASPASAKAHRALAEALYDADPGHANLDAVIAEAERAVAILDPLPGDLNSFQAYRQAAAYYLDRASSHHGDDRPAYTRALALLQRAQTFVQIGARRYPNANPEPVADIERLMAASYLGLRDGRRALDAATRARTLAPLQPLAYRLSASAHLLDDEADAAVVDLMTGSIVTGDAALNDAVIDLYRRGVDGQGCAVVTEGGRPALNLRCPLVQQHTCAAVAAAIPIERGIGRADAADRLTSTARTMACGIL